MLCLARAPCPSWSSSKYKTGLFWHTFQTVCGHEGGVHREFETIVTHLLLAAARAARNMSLFKECNVKTGRLRGQKGWGKVWIATFWEGCWRVESAEELFKVWLKSKNKWAYYRPIVNQFMFYLDILKTKDWKSMVPQKLQHTDILVLSTIV